MVEFAAARAWMGAGEQAVAGAVAGLDDVAVGQPSALPDWTRGHVISHLARNADALNNLVTWARTGVPTPMYASPEARDADIEAGAGLGAKVLTADLARAASQFTVGLDALTPEQRETVVVTRGGLSRPVRDVAWMRVREVWLHLVDLDVGFGVAGLPEDVAVAVADDVLRTLAKRADSPPFVAEVLDTGTRYEVGAGGPLVAADARTLVGWLTGRGPAPADQPAPELPAWL